MCDVMYYYFLAESMVWYAKDTKDKVVGGSGVGVCNTCADVGTPHAHPLDCRCTYRSPFMFKATCCASVQASAI